VHGKHQARKDSAAEVTLLALRSVAADVPACLFPSVPPQWDLLAGISVGFMIIPQSMSYANIAGGGILNQHQQRQQQQQVRSVGTAKQNMNEAAACSATCGCSKPPSAAHV
jgi:hypothetical protein